MLRMQMRDHFAVCLKVRVGCPYTKQGCTARPRREDLDTHVETEQLAHLGLVSATATSLQAQIAALQTQILQQDAQIAARDKQVAELDATHRADISWTVRDWPAALAMIQRGPVRTLHSSYVLVGPHSLCLTIRIPEDGARDTGYLDVNVTLINNSFNPYNNSWGPSVDVGGTTITLLHNNNNHNLNCKGTINEDTKLGGNFGLSCGFYRFYKLTDLQSHGFVHSNDSNSLHIEATVRVRKSRVVVHTQ
mmetsp:Transcript_26876/g.65851  ORF Transcript_26876/g.65851 Transcript_26876/m.65851 type:complete len:249 (+) Transcript_26876:1682-2428(+)|eukprot:CAMPEP_0197574690 /NCGR_PEP_ID=MMETSP1326-20131121/340_1 /TAXON_ID=1155430 /ORGANISM="Genus nov. species nov., Strain RCC2288" /LENGTH=248 /DNA_ID=CAMNT_0043137321 /DNA_START=204 /DNA_END=950 /DNA_ORIENTATION=+